jgi:hypothetical protein
VKFSGGKLSEFTEERQRTGGKSKIYFCLLPLSFKALEYSWGFMNAICPTFGNGKAKPTSEISSEKMRSLNYEQCRRKAYPRLDKLVITVLTIAVLSGVVAKIKS